MLAEAPPDGARRAGQPAVGPPVGRVAGADRAVDTRTASTPLEWLLARHLLEPLDDSTWCCHARWRCRCGAAARTRPGAGPPAVTFAATRDPGQVDRTAGQQAFAFVRHVDALLQAWSAAPPTVLRSGGLGVRDLARTAALLDLDEARTAAVVETAYAAGLLAADGEVDEAWCPTRRTTSGRIDGRAPSSGRCSRRPGWPMTRTPALDTERDAAGSRVNVLSREAERSGDP